MDCKSCNAANCHNCKAFAEFRCELCSNRTCQRCEHFLYLLMVLEHLNDKLEATFWPK